MKITFIIPPLLFLGDAMRNAPLGVMYLAAVVQKAGHEVTVTDLRSKTIDESLRLIPDADIYGFTCVTPDYHYCKKIAIRLRKRNPKSLLVIGGVHPTACPEKIDSVFDVIVSGEGERSIIKLIADFKKGKYKRFYREDVAVDPATLPLPARHLLPRKSLVSYSLIQKGNAATTITATRGCPFDCAFCGSKVIWGRKLRYRPVDSVIEEIKEIQKKYDIHQLKFQDDGITYNREWLVEFCGKAKPLNIVWRANARVDVSDRNILFLMRDAGCYELGYGIESPEQRVLNRINKGFNIEQAHIAFKNATDAGIKTRIFLIIGLPGQDKDVVENMIAFIKRVKPTAVDLSTFVPYPGSDIFKDPQKYGIKLKSGSDFSEHITTRGFYGDEAEKDFTFEHDILSNNMLKELRRSMLDFITSYGLVQNR